MKLLPTKKALKISAFFVGVLYKGAFNCFCPFLELSGLLLHGRLKVHQTGNYSHFI